MQKDLVCDALNYYRNIEHVNGLVLFHVKNCFVSYQDDAEKLICLCDVNIDKKDGLLSSSFPEEQLQTLLPKISDYSKGVHIVEYRNEYGIFDIPKVKQILDDQGIDY